MWLTINSLIFSTFCLNFIFKKILDKLDRAFIAFRDASKDEKIDLNSRVNLLELVELRAMKWQANGSFSLYYSTKGHKSDVRI